MERIPGYILIILILLANTGHGETQKFQVKHLSAENVYLDGGSRKGLAVGDRLAIFRKTDFVAEIEIISVAENFAAGKIVKKSKPIQTGYTAVLIREKEKTTAIQSTSAERSNATTQDSGLSQPQPALQNKTVYQRPARNAADISGSASLQFYHFNDNGPANLDFTQPTFRINFKARNLWGRQYNLRIKTRSRYNQRTRSYNANVPESEWRNRIYEFSFSYDNPAAPVNFRAGRIITNFISGVGYIDGAMLQVNTTRIFRVGIFGGFQPQWQYSRFQTSITKYGAFLNITSGEYSGLRYEGTLAAAAAYHSSTVSREFFYIRNSIGSAGKWQLFQSAEIDINRNWRREKAGESVSLSNLFVSGYYLFSPSLRAGLSFDDRKNYWTYETKSLSDSLYDTFFRRGLRGNVSIRLPRHFTIFANAGYRNREGDTESTYTYSGGLNKTNFLIRGLYFNLRGSGFSNLTTNGYNFTVRLGKYFRSGHSISASYGNYYYDFKTTLRQINNRWLRVYGQIQFLRQFFLSLQYDAGLSGDIRGNKIFGEIGYRF